MRTASSFFVAIALIFVLSPAAGEPASQDAAKNSPHKNSPYAVSRIKGPVKLDGVSDEPAWAGIDPLPMTIYTPANGSPPTEKTEILIGYDDAFFYVAGRLYDRSPDKIQAPTKKRDDISLSNDWFGIILDSFNDHENGLVFFTTPTGLRMDSTIFNDAEGDMPFDQSWNTFWDVKVVRNGEGWFAEMRIPFSSLRFQERDGRVVMGLIAKRLIARKNEDIIFPAIPDKWGFWGSFKPSQSQDIVLEGISHKTPLYVTPYVLGGFDQSYYLNEGESAYFREDTPAHEIGLDVKYGLTNNLTADLTVNPDFAQVEADDLQINLTRFSLFFPEKRLFFLERASIFDFNFGQDNNLFYSRRIGIQDEQQVRIYGGVRLTGRVGGWDIGVIDMQTAPIESWPSENFGVVRLRRQVFNPYSYVGAMITSRVGVDGNYNTAYGLDGILRLFGNDYLSFNWAQTFYRDARNFVFSLDPAKIRINWQRRTIRGLAYNLNLARAGVDYNPGMGFEMREDFTRFGDKILYGWVPEGSSWFLRHDAFVEGFVFLKNSDSQPESIELGPGWEFESKSSFSGKISPKYYYEDVAEAFSLGGEAEIPAGQYRFAALNYDLATPYTGKIYLKVLGQVGSFYDGRGFSVEVMPLWHVSSDLNLSIDWLYNRYNFSARNQKLDAHILRVKALATLSIPFSMAAFIQYNSADNLITANIRLRFNPREGNDLYIVFNDDLNTNRSRQVPPLPGYCSRALLIKYSYTFNF